MVKHVPTVAILLGVQGGLEVLGSLFAMLYGLLYGAIAVMPLASPEMAEGPENPEGLVAVMGGMSAIFLLAAAAVFALGVLKLVACFFNFRYRKRTLGMVAVASAFASLITCYCAPTGIALAVYGLIVYSQDAVRKAFAMGEAGSSSDEILRAALDLRSPYRD
ncbi:MAG: hypothetical protein ACOCUS_06930 [Polyangiales bacterium]